MAALTYNVAYVAMVDLEQFAKGNVLDLADDAINGAIDTGQGMKLWLGPEFKKGGKKASQLPAHLKRTTVTEEEFASRAP